MGSSTSSVDVKSTSTTLSARKSALASILTTSTKLSSTKPSTTFKLSSKTSATSTATTTALEHLTGAFTGPYTGAYTALSTGTPDVGIYSIITQDSGLCRLSVTDTSTLAYASYVAATTLVGVQRRNSASLITFTTGVANGGIPVGTSQIPATDIPICAEATASGVFQPAFTSNSQSGSVSSDSDHGLSAGQKAGIAIGVVLGVTLAIFTAGYLMWKKGRWSQGTPAQSNIWGPDNVVGGTNANPMTEGERIASGQGLRDVLYSGRQVGFR